MSIKSVKEHLSIIAPDLEILEFKESTATVEQAANAHNVEKGQIVKTIALIGATSFDFISGGTGSGDVEEAYTISLEEALKNSDFEIFKLIFSKTLLSPKDLEIFSITRKLLSILNQH